MEAKTSKEGLQLSHFPQEVLYLVFPYLDGLDLSLLRLCGNSKLSTCLKSQPNASFCLKLNSHNLAPFGSNLHRSVSFARLTHVSLILSLFLPSDPVFYDWKVTVLPSTVISLHLHLPYALFTLSPQKATDYGFFANGLGYCTPKPAPVAPNRYISLDTRRRVLVNDVLRKFDFFDLKSIFPELESLVHEDSALYDTNDTSYSMFATKFLPVLPSTLTHLAHSWIAPFTLFGSNLSLKSATFANATWEHFQDLSIIPLRKLAILDVIYEPLMPPEDESAALNIAYNLSELTCLAFPNTLPDHFWSYLPRLTELHLIGSPKYINFPSFISLLTAKCPLLTTLCCKVQTHSDIVKFNLILPPKLTKLHISEYMTDTYEHGTSVSFLLPLLPPGLTSLALPSHNDLIYSDIPLLPPTLVELMIHTTSFDYSWISVLPRSMRLLRIGKLSMTNGSATEIFITHEDELGYLQKHKVFAPPNLRIVFGFDHRTLSLGHLNRL